MLLSGASRHQRRFLRQPDCAERRGTESDELAGARLEAATTSGKPVLLRVSYHQGHNIMGSTRSEAEETFADIFSFMLWQCGQPGFQPGK